MSAQSLVGKEAAFLHDFAESTKEITASDNEDLRVAIAEAAYFRAEKRGFEPGYELMDWVEAEQEIKAMRAASAGDSRVQ